MPALVPVIAGLLLAAGESTRMGSPKPLLEWQGRPLVQYQVQQLKSGGCDLVVVVLGHRADRVRPFVEGMNDVVVALNRQYRAGRATSVRAGATALLPSTAWVVVLGVDQPRPAKIVAQVVNAARLSSAAIVAPTYGGRHGHPTAFAGRLLSELAQVQDATLGLRAVIQRHQNAIQEVDVASDRIFLDLNTPEDYEAARRGRGNARGEP